MSQKAQTHIQIPRTRTKSYLTRNKPNSLYPRKTLRPLKSGNPKRRRKKTLSPPRKAQGKNPNTIEEDLETTQNQSEDSRKSYRETLLPTPKHLDKPILVDEKTTTHQVLVSDEYREPHQRLKEQEKDSHPTLSISKETLKILSSKWERSLIIRVIEHFGSIQNIERDSEAYGRSRCSSRYKI